MNYIQTFYPQGKPVLENGYGWLRPEYNLMSWALSCLQLRKIYDHVDLYTDNMGKNILIDELGLPYNKVYTDFNEYDQIDQHLWALPKIYTYSKQQNPFLHIDGDVYLFDKLPEKFNQSELIAQNMEYSSKYYLDTMVQLKRHFTYIPEVVKSDFNSDKSFLAVNAGILGGNDVIFFKNYTKEAYTYIKRNQKHLKEIDADKFNVFFEQHLFYALAHKACKKVSLLFKDLENSYGYTHLADFLEINNRVKYIHLLGNFKRDEDLCLQMAITLRNLYPEYYYRICRLYHRKHLPFCITTPEINSCSIEEYHQICLNAYHGNKISNTQHHVADASKEMELLTRTEIGRQHPEKLDKFADDVNKICKKFCHLSKEFVYGRDLECMSWQDKASRGDRITISKEACIITSSYNWGGKLNQLRRSSIEYYERVNFDLEGEYYCIVVPELLAKGYQIHDIDDVELCIFEELHEPKTLEELLDSCTKYFDDEIIRKNYLKYEIFIGTLIKRLISIKAIHSI